MALARILTNLAAVAALAVTAATAQAQTPLLTLKVYHADADSFNVNSVLISGRTDAVLLDTGFTRADAMRITAMVLDSRETLKTICISQPDPDYHFGIDVLKSYFPDVKVVATVPTIKKIEATLPAQLAFWPSKMGANAPKATPLPELLAGSTITLEGQTLEIRGLDDRLPHRSYMGTPSISAVGGGVNVFAGLHAWTAKASSAEDRAAWSKKLGEIAALQPAVVVPGHSASGEAQDVSQVAYTQAYLQRWDAEVKKAHNSAELIGAMKAAYPTAGLGVALDISVQVAQGEMKW